MKPRRKLVGAAVKRRQLLIASSVLLAPAALFAQSKASKIPRIGLLMPGMASNGVVGMRAFRDGLRELNYVEGRNVILDVRWAEGDMAKLNSLAKALVQEKVDVIVTGATLPTQAAKAATSVIPIVATGVADLAESGLVASLAKPGGNLTGVAVAFSETGAKQLEIMREVLPNGKRVAVLWPGPVSAFFQRQRKEIEARAARLELTWQAPRTQSELPATFQSIQNSRPDFLVVLSDAFYFAHRREVVVLAAGVGIPAVYGFREYVDDGGLISYGASITESFRRAASYVGKILNGASPADLPVQMPSRLELVVNAKTARALGLQIPRSVLARADAVVN